MPTPVTPDAAPGAQSFEWSESLHTFLFRARIYLKRYWWIFLLTISLGILMQALKQINTAPRWSSSAELIVNSRIVMPGTNVIGEDFQTNILMMKSDMMREKAYEHAAALDPDLAKLNPSVDADVNQITGSGILQLTATGSDPKFTQDYLDAWMDTFIDYKKQMQTDQIKSIENEYMVQADEYEKKIQDDNDAMVRFSQENNMITVENEEKTAGDRLSGLIDTLSDKQSQLRLLNSIDPNAYIAGDQSVEAVDHSLLNNKDLVTVSPEYWQDKQNLVELKALYDEMATYLYPNHPKMRRLSDNIAAIQNRLQVQRRQTMADLQGRLLALQADITNLNEDIKTWKEQALKYSALRSDSQKLDSQLEMDTKTHESTLANINGLDVMRELDQSVFRKFEDASVAQPIRLNPVQQIGAGAFIGLVGGGVLIFLLGALDGRVMSVEDITQRFDEPMLGVIPMQKRGSGGQVELLRNNDKRQMFAESCRNIRSSLLYMDRQGQRPRVIMLTSSIPAEGKSTLSANLAITLGFAASHTLLVDADLRLGKLHQQFGLPNDLGLAEHIHDNIPVDKVIQKTQFENVDFIPCGKYPAQPGELLMSQRFVETLKELRQRYDFVIFDSPPILPTDDAPSFAMRADAVLFVVRAGYTRLRQIRTALEALHRRGVNVYGMVVNFIDHREPGYYSYRYYDYYSAREDRKE